MKIKILIPVYNDWQSAFKLLENINSEVSNLGHEFSVIIVNDASTESRPELSKNLDNLNSIKIINMKENRGHARCNASGLKHIYENEEFDYVIPMDSDGEDRPEEIKSFLQYIKYDEGKPIVGERVKRSENIIFKTCYHFHKIITYVFTGHSIKFGNYTCLPKSTVEKLINDKSTWCSFSGALAKLEKDRSASPSERGTRYFGPSKMSFKNLIKHSLAIIAVFKSTVIIRSILFYAIYLILMADYISVVTAIPLALIIAFGLSVVMIGRRENLDELNNSLSNIESIDTVK